MQKLYVKIVLWIWDRLDWIEKSNVIKAISPVYVDHKSYGSVGKWRDSFEAQRKAEFIKEIKSILLTRHSRLRINQRYGSLTKQNILDDIKSNIKDIVVRRDKRYQIITEDNTYIFTDRHHLVTTYPNKKDMRTRIKENLQK